MSVSVLSKTFPVIYMTSISIILPELLQEMEMKQLSMFHLELWHGSVATDIVSFLILKYGLCFVCTLKRHKESVFQS